MDTSARLPGWKRDELAVRMASSCIFFIISMPEENPKCGDVIGNRTKESHALGSKVENIDLNDKTTKRKSAFQFKGKCAGFRARSALRPAALCFFWLVSEVSYVQLGQRQFKYSCGHYLYWKTSGKCGSSGREREKEKAIVLALLLRHSRGFASMSFQSTPVCTASGTRSNIR